MKCLNCGQEITLENSKYCNNCGTKLPSRKKQCPTCAKLNDGEALFCKYCGTSLDDAEIIYIEEAQVVEAKPVEAEEDYSKPPKKIRLFALLGFLLAFSPIMFSQTKVASFIISLIILIKLAKLKKEHPEMNSKKQKVFAILGMIFSVVFLIIMVLFYIFLLFTPNLVQDLLQEIPEYFV